MARQTKGGVGLVLRFWWNFELTKYSQNFAQTFGESFGNISPPTWAISLPTKKVSSEITYTMLSNIFVNVLKLEFLPKCLILLQNFGKIQSLGQTFSRNFLWNTDETFGAATLGGFRYEACEWKLFQVVMG